MVMAATALVKRVVEAMPLHLLVAGMLVVRLIMRCGRDLNSARPLTRAGMLDGNANVSFLPISTPAAPNHSVHAHCVSARFPKNW